jgi:hypothetical protein
MKTARLCQTCAEHASQIICRENAFQGRCQEPTICQKEAIIATRIAVPAKFRARPKLIARFTLVETGRDDAVQAARRLYRIEQIFYCPLQFFE